MDQLEDFPEIEDDEHSEDSFGWEDYGRKPSLDLEDDEPWVFGSDSEAYDSESRTDSSSILDDEEWARQNGVEWD